MERRAKGYGEICHPYSGCPVRPSSAAVLLRRVEVRGEASLLYISITLTEVQNLDSCYKGKKYEKDEACYDREVDN